MASNNPAFNNPAFQDSRAVNSYPGGAQAATLGGTAGASTNAAAAANLEGMYAAPPADAVNTDRMTVEDTIYKTVGLFAILLVTAVAGWLWSMSTVATTTQGTTMPTMAPMLVGGLGGFIMAMVVIFGSRKKIRPGAIFAYAALEGLFIGGISAYFEFIWPGIVIQATLATLSVVGVTLALFASGKVRASKKATKIFMIAMLGYLVFSLVNVVMMMFGATGSAGPFGLLSNTIAGIPIGLIVGVLVVIMAAYSLVLDFDSIQRGVKNNAPRVYGWMGAFGIMVTVVWLYTELLRMIAILRGGE